MPQPETGKGKQCAATRQDGQRCRSLALASGFCFTHDPALAAERAEARSRGGRNHSNHVRLRGLVPPKLVPVYDKLETALAEVYSGKLTPQQATAMASVARAMVVVVTSGETEERMRAIEERLREIGRWAH